MNSSLLSSSFRPLLSRMQVFGMLIPAGEGTWNQITTRGDSGTAASSRTAGDGYCVRLHLGNAITRAQHQTLAEYVSRPDATGPRTAAALVLRGLPSKDHAHAVVLLSNAIRDGVARYWQISLNGDKNENGSVYHVDVSTEATIPTEKLAEVRAYLDTREGPGKNVLMDIFVRERADPIAAEILDLPM